MNFIPLLSLVVGQYSWLLQDRQNPLAPALCSCENLLRNYDVKLDELLGSPDVVQTQTAALAVDDDCVGDGIVVDLVEQTAGSPPPF